MKSIVLCAAVLSLPAHGEWLTVVGEAGNPSSDYFQVSPDSVRSLRHLRFVGLRASRAQAEVGRDGVTFRSFDATAVIDCERGTARYVTTRYFQAPNFEGTPETVQNSVGRRPVISWMTADGRPARLIKSICAIGEVEKASGRPS